MSYKKLVRDNIPEIIRGSGNIPITRVLSQKEYRSELRKKLSEEVQEYLLSRQVEELADIIEVCIALAESANVPEEELFKIRCNKRLTRGAFRHRIYLDDVIPRPGNISETTEPEVIAK